MPHLDRPRCGDQSRVVRQNSDGEYRLFPRLERGLEGQFLDAVLDHGAVLENPRDGK